MNKSIFVCGMRVDMVQIPEVTGIIEEWIQNKKFGNDIVIANANDAILSKKNEEVRNSVNNSSLSVPDGISMVLLGRLYGYPLKKRVYGPDLMFEFLKLSDKKGYSHFFYGATQEVLSKMEDNIKGLFPRLKIAGSYAPPFRRLSEQEDREITAMINDKHPDVLWVGIGCPKQQLWMSAHKSSLKVPAMVGVGAAFDFFAKTKPQAPRWLRDRGFEWLFRLVTEPGRLWKRYIIDGSLFVCSVAGQLLGDIVFRKKK